MILLEQEDLGSAASSASPRLIHGDLAALERRGFFRVRTALAERDIWLRTAPHLVRLRAALLLVATLRRRAGARKSR